MTWLTFSADQTTADEYEPQLITVYKLTPPPKKKEPTFYKLNPEESPIRSDEPIHQSNSPTFREAMEQANGVTFTQAQWDSLHWNRNDKKRSLGP